MALRGTVLLIPGPGKDLAAIHIEQGNCNSVTLTGLEPAVYRDSDIDRRHCASAEHTRTVENRLPTPKVVLHRTDSIVLRVNEELL